MQPAYKTQKDRGDTHTRRKAQESKADPAPSSAQWHSSHSNRTLLINSIRSHRQRDRLMERHPDVALSTTSPLFCHLPFLFFPSIQLSFPLSSVPIRSPGKTALKKKQSPKNVNQKKYENQLATHWEPPLFSEFLFFPDLSLLILFSPL